MLDENELLFDELYEKTKNCSRVQFIKLLMEKERENQELKTMQCTFLGTGCQNKVKKYESQQKEFIEWLEDMLVSELDIFTVVRVCDVLSKYKEIIGIKDE